jgi:hypothetical protein
MSVELNRPAGPATRPREHTGGRRLPPPLRKLLLVVHLVGALGLLGTDLTVLLLSTAGATGTESRTVYPAAHLIGVTLLVPLALVALGTGLLQGLLTPWGLVRHWWVTLKLGLTVAGTVLALRVLTPALDAAAHAALTGELLSSRDRWLLVRDSGAASVVLVITVLLSVYKPFGRIRRRRS